MKKIGSCILVSVILMCVMSGTVFAADSGDNAAKASNVSVTSCTVSVAIDDDTCVGYEVYIDGAYQFTEGQGTIPDGFCSFYVTEGTHTLEIRKNGCSASKTHNFLCGVSYTWASMPDYWCEGGGGDCDNPPTVYFDKTSYYEGDKVQITVSTIHSSVYYEIKDCSGTVRKTGYTSGGTISYTIPDGSTSSCCYWTICFYWDEGGDPLGPMGAAGNINVESYQCTKCYNFYVCPDTCDAYVEIEDKVCFGYDVYVDGVLQFTEGQGTTPDGYCSFTVSEGYHTIEIRKDGCSEIVFSYQYFQCNGQYKKILQNYWCDCDTPTPPPCDNPPTVQFDKLTYCEGDTIHATVSAPHMKNRLITYEIKDCSGTVRKTGNTIDGSKIEYTIPLGTSSSCCKWSICFSWKVLWEEELYQCGPECYDFEVCPDLKPDLIVEEITRSPSNPDIEQSVTFTVKIKNNGDANAESSHAKLLIDGTEITTVSIGALSAGLSTTRTFSWTASGCGDHNVKAIADCNNEVTESDEWNNERTESVHVKCPDLMVEDITWNPSNPEIGQSVTFTVKIKNNGDANAESSHAKFLIGGTEITTVSVGALSAGSSTTRTFTWTASGCGDHTVKAIADCNNEVTESDEWNNEGTESVHVKCPDLIVEEIIWSPPNPDIEQSVTFTVKIKNNGDANAVSSNAKFMIGGKEIKTVPVGELSAGSSTTRTFSWTASGCGDHNVKAIADCNNEVTESDEWNNEGTESVHVKCPDLMVEEIIWSPSNPDIEQSVTLTVKIKNNGDGNAESSHAKILIDGTEIKTVSVGALSAGSSTTKTFTWTASGCGDHIVKAIADCNNEVTESDEWNNEGTESVHVKCPDLIVEEITWNPTNPEIEQSVTFTVKIKNNGDANAESSHAKFMIGGTEIKTVSVGAISAGSSTTKTFTWTASGCGDHTVKAIADCNNEVTESDEGNNEWTESVHVKCPDLIVEEIIWSPSNPDIEQSVTLTVKIKNNGDGNAESSHAKFLIGGTEIKTVSVGALNAGSSTTKTFTWTASGCGDHIVKAIADCNNEVTENDENNNARTEPVRVQCPDLIVEDLTWTPSKPKIGQSTSFTVKIENTGDGNAKASHVKLLIGGTEIKTVSVIALNAGSSTTKTFTWTASGCGDHNVKAVADCNNEVTESNENNNDKTDSIDVNCPDIIIQDISCSFGNPEEGDTITFTVKIKNQGDGNAGSSTVKYYIDDSYVASDSVSSLSAGSTSTQTFTWTANKCGDVKVKAAADANKKIKESDETNNEKEKTFNIKCPELPDLVVESITWKIKEGTENTVEVTVTIKNQGEADAKGFTLKYYVDGKEHDSDSISSLSKGSTTTETFSWNANGKNPGDHGVKVIADAGNKIKESSEDNNVKTATITCIDMEIVSMDIVQVINSSKLNYNLVRDKPFEVRLNVRAKPSSFDRGCIYTIEVNSKELFRLSAFFKQGGQEEVVKLTELLIRDSGKNTIEACILPTTVMLSPAAVCPDPNLENNVAEKDVVFRDHQRWLGDFKIYYVPIDFPKDRDADYHRTVTDNHLFIEDTYPIPRFKLDFDFLSPSTNSLSSPPRKNANVPRRKNVLLWNKMESVRKEVGADRLVGVVPKGWLGGNTKGLHWGRDSVLVEEGTDTAAAHEIGHTFCLCDEYNVTKFNPKRTNQCVESRVLCWFSNPNAPGKTGEDQNDVFDEGRKSDAYPGKRCMMGSTHPISNTWICHYCYIRIFEMLIGYPISTSGINSQSLTEQENIQTNQSPTEVLFISGIVYKNGSVEFYELSRMNDQIPDQIMPGNYSIECLDADGNVLSETPFDVSFYTEYGEGEVNVTGFAFAIPYMPGTKKVMVKYNGELKDEFVLSANSPTVSVISPNGRESFSGSFTVTWAANDPDGDELSYTLLYSNNEGADWSILAMDINETSHAVNTSMLGGGTKCMVKVIASDGANTAEDTSEGCFTVETKNPIASISSPENNSEFMEWDRIEFSGLGYDLDDGMLPDDSLVWTSSIDGVIGYGSSFSNTSLSAGMHLITLTARDSEGETANVTIVINVLSREPFDTWQSENQYPSIAGTHTGTITLNQTITVSKFYTYPCAGTGGHTESVRIYGNEIDESASWNGYAEDGDTLTFNSSFTLEEGKTYNYVIETGSYPQIHHTAALQTENGWINCTSFVDANGKEYNDWIPAIKMC